MTAYFKNAGEIAWRVLENLIFNNKTVIDTII